jgi:hypothetical protein
MRNRPFNPAALISLFAPKVIFLVLFLLQTIFPVSLQASLALPNAGNLPVPGTALNFTGSFDPLIFKGMIVHPENPWLFDFILNIGHVQPGEDELKDEGLKMIRYFLSALTIPEKEIWVNLSPFEKDRITSANLAETEMGDELLAQDYLLKQLTASLLSPDHPVGKKFWDRVNERTGISLGNEDRQIESFSKVWIAPEKAIVREDNDKVFIIENRLKILLEQDYNAMAHSRSVASSTLDEVAQQTRDAMREIIIPELEREINSGSTFANLRQIFNSMILATWYKQYLRESILGQSYADKALLGGVLTTDPQMNEKIFERYVESYTKGVGDAIREELDPVTKELVPRRYVLGGIDMESMPRLMVTDNSQTPNLPGFIYIVEAVMGNAPRIRERHVPAEDARIAPESALPGQDPVGGFAFSSKDLSTQVVGSGVRRFVPGSAVPLEGLSPVRLLIYKITKDALMSGGPLKGR